jgi:hypothetical protein
MNQGVWKDTADSFCRVEPEQTFYRLLLVRSQPF